MHAMMIKLMTIFAAFCLIASSACAEIKVSSDALGHRVARKLRALGFEVTEADIPAYSKELLSQESGFNALAGIFGFDEKRDRMEMFLALMNAGLGEYDYNTGTWTPTSSQVYAFDAEVFDIEHMYTLFLRGVESIVPGLTISAVQEDLSGIKEDSGMSMALTDGIRSVRFLCNGHAYETELESMGDWFNPLFIDFVNTALEQEGFKDRLHVVSGEMEQMVIIIYGTEERAGKIRSSIGMY